MMSGRRQNGKAFTLIEPFDADSVVAQDKLPAMRKGKASGFTLIELLVVIAIISLLVSILLPSLNQAKELARRAVCGSNQHNICLAIRLYATEHDDFVPPLAWNYNMQWVGWGVEHHFFSAIYPAYADKGIFYDPGYRFHDGAYAGSWGWAGTPKDGWPDEYGNIRMSYNWWGYGADAPKKLDAGGWAGWDFLYGHQAVRIDSQVTVTSNGIEAAVPSRVSPLCCIGNGDFVSDIWGVSHYRDGDPALGIEGQNVSYLDGHVTWVGGGDLSVGFPSGPYYLWVSDYE